MNKSLLVFLLFLLAFLGCKKKGSEEPIKEEPKTTVPIITAKIVGGSYKLIQVKGDVDYDGGTPVTEYGVCYSTSSNPTVLNNKIKSTYNYANSLGNLNKWIV